MNTILIIDDEPTIRMLLGRILELEGYEILQAADRHSALALLRRQGADVQVILCDVLLPDGNGVQMIPEMQELAPRSNIIILTAHGNISDGVQAIKSGAFDYITKGDDNRKIIPLVSRAMDEANRRADDCPAPASDGSAFESVIGKSALFQEAIRLAGKVALSDVSVLLTGETGTGKEIFAGAIHRKSNRRNRPFVAINCSAFSRELLESELFGHMAGAFTGAVKNKKGLFEEADGGTIFLDEIGEMEYGLQAKLLRALETGEFIKVGDTRPTKVDVRVIAATNRNLKKEIDSHHFREDLYFRLSVFQIELPPLRCRQGDVRLLAEHFVRTLSRKMNLSGIVLGEESLRIMERYSWPGNIRELRNVIERSLIVCNGEITPDDLPVDLHSNDNGPDSPIQQFDLATVERNHIVKILNHTRGNKTATARLLKIGLTTLYRKIEEYGI